MCSNVLLTHLLFRLFSFMQRRYSEPNTYIDTPPSISQNSDDLYDDVASIADPEVCSALQNTFKFENSGTSGVLSVDCISFVLDYYMFLLRRQAHNHLTFTHSKKTFALFLTQSPGFRFPEVIFCTLH